MQLTFLVQGSSPEPYTVTFELAAGAVAAYCTCAAGLAGQSCKHRLALLAGDFSAAQDHDPSCRDRLASAFEGSALQRAIESMRNAEVAVEAAKREVSRAKKEVDKVMRGTRGA